MHTPAPVPSSKTANTPWSTCTGRHTCTVSSTPSNHLEHIGTRTRPRYFEHTRSHTRARFYTHARRTPTQGEVPQR